jgi:REP element-mobilizing transposase RayT
MQNARQRYLHASARNQPLPAEAYATAGTAVAFTVRAYRERPFEANPALCSAVIELLREARTQYGCWVGAYCLMPDHLHLVAGPLEGGSSVLIFLNRFKGKSTNTSWRHNWEGRLWQSRFHDHVLRSSEALADISRYVLENPVRAGLVEAAEDWPWSGVMDPEYR